MQYDIVVLRTQQTGWGESVVTWIGDQFVVGDGRSSTLSHDVSLKHENDVTTAAAT